VVADCADAADQRAQGDDGAEDDRAQEHSLRRGGPAGVGGERDAQREHEPDRDRKHGNVPDVDDVEPEDVQLPPGARAGSEDPVDDPADGAESDRGHEDERSRLERRPPFRYDLDTRSLPCFAVGPPHGKVRASDPSHPSRSTPALIATRSPATITRFEATRRTDRSLSTTQNAPSNAGVVVPSRHMRSSNTPFSSTSRTPVRSASTAAPSASSATEIAVRIRSTSTALFTLRAARMTASPSASCAFGNIAVSCCSNSGVRPSTPIRCAPETPG